MVRKIFATAILTIACMPLFAQESNGVLTPIHKSEIGIAGGFSYYTGDFNESFVPYMVSPSAGLFFRYNFTKYINLRAQISAGTIKGDSRNYEYGLQGFPKGRNMVFKRNFYAAEAYGEFNFLPYSSVDPRKKQIFTPFLIVGLGYAYFTKNTENNQPYLSAASAAYPALYDSTKTTGSITIPMGFGFKFSPATQWTLGIECIFRKTTTDKLDGYINRSSKDGFNIYNKDWITAFSITLSYRFVDKSACKAYKTNKSTKKRYYNGINNSYK